ncbi:MAG TPA: rod shape-determining protein MreC [Patescibacteria group bacterium]
MQKKNLIFPYVIISLVFLAFVLLLGVFGWLGFFKNSIQGSIFSFGNLLQSSENQTQIDKLKAQNAELTKEVAQYKMIKDDNKALRDQFNDSSFSPSSLLPSRVVGEPSVLPNISLPEELIIDKGRTSGLERGDAVIVKDNAVGQIEEVSDYFSKVMLVSDKNFALSGKDSNTGAVGIIKGLGNGNILFDGVLLSDNLKVGDIIVSSGSQDMLGKGFPPNIVIGKVSAVEKNPSALFQSGQVVPLISFSKQSIVFVLKKL